MELSSKATKPNIKDSVSILGSKSQSLSTSSGVPGEGYQENPDMVPLKCNAALVRTSRVQGIIIKGRSTHFACESLSLEFKDKDSHVKRMPCLLNNKFFNPLHFRGAGDCNVVLGQYHISCSHYPISRASTLSDHTRGHAFVCTKVTSADFSL